MSRPKIVVRSFIICFVDKCALWLTILYGKNVWICLTCSNYISCFQQFILVVFNLKRRRKKKHIPKHLHANSSAQFIIISISLSPFVLTYYCWRCCCCCGYCCCHRRCLRCFSWMTRTFCRQSPKKHLPPREFRIKCVCVYFTIILFALCKSFKLWMVGKHFSRCLKAASNEWQTRWKCEFGQICVEKYSKIRKMVYFLRKRVPFPKMVECQGSHSNMQKHTFLWKNLDVSAIKVHFATFTYPSGDTERDK